MYFSKHSVSAVNIEIFGALSAIFLCVSNLQFIFRRLFSLNICDKSLKYLVSADSIGQILHSRKKDVLASSNQVFSKYKLTNNSFITRRGDALFNNV